MTASSTRERGQDSEAPSGAQDQSVRQYWLPPHVRICRTVTGAVVLDLKRNRYFGIGKKEAYTLGTLEADSSCADLGFARPDEAMTPQALERIADHLVEIGFLSRDPPTDRRIAPGDIDLKGQLTSVGHEINGSQRIALGHVCNFLRACAWARRAVGSRTLYSVACELSDDKSRHPGRLETQRTIDLVCIFRRLRPFAFAAKNQCLFHALALARFLSFYQVFPTWVVGVRARPWAAHSWVQHGSLLLDSNPEHVCEYTPILTV
jgi:hypothetical protein